MSAHGFEEELPVHHSIYLRRWRNLTVFPLYRLGPNELILEIVERAVQVFEGKSRFWMVLIAICRPLREMLTRTPLPSPFSETVPRTL